ncbi:hypothetical protein G4B88_022612 [Cannabis sativa]|uniref:Uncharacterized protein n=1 Tax=Cannabis sativa TaxID=3483 RepID=A0A7J6HXF5_CANSA|nr:hypothetical protein G4B88_022612 [Cannabis sativa]
MEKKEAKIVKKYTKSFEKITCARSHVGVEFNLIELMNPIHGRRHGRTKQQKEGEAFISSGLVLLECGYWLVADDEVCSRWNGMHG